ncbi:ABC transporter ATP-binding protein [Micromonospora yasonensis]|uniref:ABC transporter ATP-binding protein n=1 Tax=Micromonospora yasonensis TaxID=1128667 RepID=UPI002231E4C0|nr:ABC transporter ATP-binding protein [Micromonospora yasonensis]MCW3845427.1 ABC transporter ATP-binding protein [Micromonospora yasonensis]
MRLRAEGVELAYDQFVIATDLSLTIPDGKVSVLIGPNGCGKSTALRALSRLLRPRQGEVVLDGKTIHSFSTKEVARRLAILPQLLSAPEAITVEDLVWFGRHPHRRSLSVPSTVDKDAVEWALEVTGTESLRRKSVDQLSGGQRQRAWIALCLAQGTDLILLDEPTTFLDVAYQLEVLDLLAELNRTQGKTVAMVLHDFNMAAEYADHIFVMKSGALVTEGPPEQVLTPPLLHEVFGIEAQVQAHPVSGKPLCIPIKGRSRTTSDGSATPVAAVAK